jgi:predicted RNA-binding protein associated with RNAse of E/G family
VEQSGTAPALVAQRIYDFEPVAATLVGDLLYSDQEYWRHAGKRRCFWLLEEDVQLVYEPFGWHGEWYVDLVSFERTEQDGLPLFTVRDQYLDVVVEGMGPTYRLIDLDEAAAALVSGELSASQLARTMVKAQEFTDRYLHRGAVFPPPALRDLFDPGHRYPGWAQQPVRLRA